MFSAHPHTGNKKRFPVIYYRSRTKHFSQKPKLNINICLAKTFLSKFKKGFILDPDPVIFLVINLFTSIRGECFDKTRD